MKEDWVDHEFPPFVPEGARLLILGSFPSVKSREEGFYYGHPQNRFWRVLAGVYDDVLPCSLIEKKSFLTRHKIALYDVIERCLITGSSDASIRDAQPADIASIIKRSGIKLIYANGAKSAQYYARYQEGKIGIKALRLPSTSAANASWNLERLIEAWKVIKGETSC